MARILFVCLHNAAIAVSLALFERSPNGRGPPAGPRFASIRPWQRDRAPLELRERKPRLLTDDLARRADVVITMACGDACPVIPGKRYIDWDLQDPKDLPLAEVREIRDDIASRVSSLIKDIDQARIRG